MLKKTHFIILLFLFSLCSAAELFTLQGAIDYAIAHSPQYEILKRERAITRSQAFQGYGAVLPNISLTHSNASTKLPIESQTNTTTKVTNLSVQQLLFSFSGIAAVKAGNAAKIIAEHNFAEARELFVLAVKRKYYDLQIARQLVAINKVVYDNASQQAKNAEIRYKNGLAPKTYYLDARVTQLNAQRELATTEKNFMLSLQDFNNYIGRELSAELEMVTVDVKIAERSIEQPLLTSELSQTAYEKRPLYLAYLQLVKLAESDNINAWGNSLPQVYYQYSNQDREQIEESAFSPNGITETSSVYLSWNFFAGGANWHKIGEKKHSQEKTNLEREILRNNIKIEIESNIREVELAVTNYNSAVESAALAAESLKLVQLSFKEGLATNNDFNSALSSYMRAQTAKAKAGFDYYYAIDKLNYSVGAKVI